MLGGERDRDNERATSGRKKKKIGQQQQRRLFVKPRFSNPIIKSPKMEVAAAAAAEAVTDKPPGDIWNGGDDHYGAGVDRNDSCGSDGNGGIDDDNETVSTTNTTTAAAAANSKAATATSIANVTGRRNSINKSSSYRHCTTTSSSSSSSSTTSPEQHGQEMVAAATATKGTAIGEMFQRQSVIDRSLTILSKPQLDFVRHMFENGNDHEVDMVLDNLVHHVEQHHHVEHHHQQYNVHEHHDDFHEHEHTQQQQLLPSPSITVESHRTVDIDQQDPNRPTLVNGTTTTETEDRKQQMSAASRQLPQPRPCNNNSSTSKYQGSARRQSVLNTRRISCQRRSSIHQELWSKHERSLDLSVGQTTNTTTTTCSATAGPATTTSRTTPTASGTTRLPGWKATTSEVHVANQPSSKINDDDDDDENGDDEMMTIGWHVSASASASAEADIELPLPSPLPPPTTTTTTTTPTLQSPPPVPSRQRLSPRVLTGEILSSTISEDITAGLEKKRDQKEEEGEKEDEEKKDGDDHEEDREKAVSPRHHSSSSSSSGSSSGISKTGQKRQTRNNRHEMVRNASVSIYHGQGFEVGETDMFFLLDSSQTPTEHYDPWKFQDIDEDGHRRSDVHIIGTSLHDKSAQPHVLNPKIMHELQPFLPTSQQGSSFWLKYSLVRDGGSISSFLKHARGAQTSILAIETVDGDVFGAYCSQPWTAERQRGRGRGHGRPGGISGGSGGTSSSFYGTGETFLWKLEHSRTESYDGVSLLEQSHRESSIQIFGSGSMNGINGGMQFYENDFYQYCRPDKIALGGGVSPSSTVFYHDVEAKLTQPSESQQLEPTTYSPDQLGFALVFEGGTMIEASSSACMTFHSPPLARNHPDGSKFEVINVELWGLTPCLTEPEAQLMENRHLFLKRHATM